MHIQKAGDPRVDPQHTEEIILLLIFYGNITELLSLFCAFEGHD